MSLTVKELFDSVDKKIMGQVKWNEKINCRLPGVYCVSISSKEDVLETIEEYPVSLNKIEEWIEYVPDMKADGKRQYYTLEKQELLLEIELINTIQQN